MNAHDVASKLYCVPALVTLVCVLLMFRPFKPSEMTHRIVPFRIGWLIPVIITWYAYSLVLMIVS